MKRIFDIVLSSIGLIISFPLWVFFGLAILLEDGRPIFYLQERVGKGGKIFKNFKFRSMIKKAESKTGAVWAKENDPRVTRIGAILRATAMDELPQLLNIFLGDISFVGPRPERPEFVRQFTSEFPDFDLRHKIKPGLTGVAQVFGSAYTDYHMKFKYDMWYMKNQSLPLDLYLIFLSFLVTFRAKWEDKKDKFGGAAARVLKARIENELKELK